MTTIHHPAPAGDEWARLATEISGCHRCPRLREFCTHVAQTKRRRYETDTYWGRPVPGFGDPAARLLIVGLAPAAHGANRTGRMFTGDAAGSGHWVYSALHRRGRANQATATHTDDGLRLSGAYIINAVRCAPPDNRPLPAELTNCRPYLQRELDLLTGLEVILALGRIAFTFTVQALAERGLVPAAARPIFAHGAAVRFTRPTDAAAGPGTAAAPTLALLASYHPSRQNTQTGVLTPAMWDTVFDTAENLLGDVEAAG